MTESRQQAFLRDFWETYTQFMKERGLKTYDDILKYFAKARQTKRQALGAVRWRYKSEELDDVLNRSVDWAKSTKDRRNIGWLEEYLKKNEEGWLTMLEADEVREYFARNGRFNFEWTKDAAKYAEETHLYENFIDWERKTAKENWIDDLADLNNEIKAWYVLKQDIRDMTKIWKKWASLYDFFIAWTTWDIKSAVWYLFSKNLFESAVFRETYQDVLEKMLSNNATVKDLWVNFEKIQAIQDEKEYLKFLDDMWIKYKQLPYKEWIVDDWWKTVLKQWDTIIWLPDWRSVVKQEITEIPPFEK